MLNDLMAGWSGPSDGSFRRDIDVVQNTRVVHIPSKRHVRCGDIMSWAIVASFIHAGLRDVRCDICELCLQCSYMENMALVAKL